MRAIAPLAVGLGGALTTALVAAAGHLPVADELALLGYSAVGSAAAYGIGRLLLAGRATPLRTRYLAAAVVPLAGAVIGIYLAAAQMFVSTHDRTALLVVLTATGTLGVASTIATGRRLTAATGELGRLARDLDGVGPMAPASSALPAEMAALASELEATSARLAESRARERALDASRRELVAWVSHDLRTPLAGIRAMVEALEDGIVDDEADVARYHRTIRSEADRLAGLVDDLFELSRINAGALRLDRRRVALADLVSDAIAGAGATAAAKGVIVDGSAAEPSAVVELSAAEMARVVRNLVDNAIRHTPSGGRITVEASMDGDAAVVSVHDQCGGIPELDLDRVFDLAYRGDTARTPGDGGAGLGLAIARGLVEAHAGDISVCNEPPGCRFTVRLPLAAAAP